MTDWKTRLSDKLEPILRQHDPRPQLSAYHNMPYAIFLYPPEDEFSVRREVALLKTRLEQAGKRIISVSLAECMADALEAEGMTPESLAQAERKVGLETVIETVHEILSNYQRLDNILVAKISSDQDPHRDILFIDRAGALFPVYRTSTLLEHLMGRLNLPGILFYPGAMEGAAGLKFMGKLDAEHNYRPRIF